jgi:aspartate racemase
MASSTELIAILGGMGPLASAAFLSTVYERTTSRREQDMPRVMVWSDPTLPDRTTALRDGRGDLLAQAVQCAMEQCERAGATQFVICCVTAHAVMPLLPASLRSRTVSLVDLLLGAVIERQVPQLVCSSSGTREARVLERHPLWPQARPWLRWLDDHEQARMHQALYAIKLRGTPADAAALIEPLVHTYGVRSFVAACTELHLLTRYWAGAPPVEWIDPLDLAADRLIAPHPDVVPMPTEAS